MYSNLLELLLSLNIRKRAPLRNKQKELQWKIQNDNIKHKTKQSHSYKMCDMRFSTQLSQPKHEPHRLSTSYNGIDNF